MAQKQGRPPGSKTKSKNTAPNKQVEKPKRSEYFCSMCGERFTRQSGNFPTSRSPLYAQNEGYLTICKSCVENLYLHYSEVLNDELSAIERTCMKIDCYFNLTIAESCLATANGKAVIMNYISRTALPQYKSKNFDTTLDEYDYIEACAEAERPISEDEKREQRIKADAKHEWGLDNLTLDDIQFLNNEFADWNARTNVSGKARENLVRDLCVLKLQQNKALDAEDNDTYNKLNQTYQKVLQTASLTPKQVEDDERASELPMGVMIKRFEDEDPIGEPEEEWKDVDGIMRLILVFFIGHLCSMLHIKNKYAEEYEETMERYSANIPEESGVSDTEDIFEYFLNNGFSTIEKPEEEEGEGDDKN